MLIAGAGIDCPLLSDGAGAGPGAGAGALAQATATSSIITNINPVANLFIRASRLLSVPLIITLMEQKS